MLCCLTLQAQFSAGIEGGYNKNYLYTNTANRAFTTYNPSSGFSIGIPVQYTFSGWFSLMIDPNYSQKNYSLSRSDYYQGIYQINTNGYVQLPLITHFMFGGERIKGFLNTGIYGAYWASGKVKGTIPNILDMDSLNNSSGNSIYNTSKPATFNEKYQFDSRKDRRIDFGWLLGIGASYNLSEKYQLFIEGRYYQSILDQQKSYMVNQVPRYNQTYGISAGCMINLQNKSYGKP